MSARKGKSKRGPGRPSKALDDKTLDLFRTALLAGCNLKDSCAYAEIDYSTYMSWQQRAEEDRAKGINSEYVQFVDKAKATMDQAKPRLETIVSKAAEKDPRLGLMILERRYPKEWGKQVQIGGAPNAEPIVVRFVDVEVKDGERTDQDRKVQPVH